MRPHDEFWQAVFRRAVGTRKGDAVDLTDWTMHTRPATDAELDRLVNGPGGFVDAMLGHADTTRRILTLFVHKMVWDEPAVSEQLRGGGDAEQMAAWWLVESLRSIESHLRADPKPS